jgi:hypothetical protein
VANLGGDLEFRHAVARTAHVALRYLHIYRSRDPTKAGGDICDVAVSDGRNIGKNGRHKKVVGNTGRLPYYPLLTIVPATSCLLAQQQC